MRNGNGIGTLASQNMAHKPTKSDEMTRRAKAWGVCSRRLASRRVSVSELLLIKAKLPLEVSVWPRAG
jgi:hypothetical protein